jgi:elongation factor P
VQPDVAIAALAARQYGVVARRQLVELGLSARQIDHRVGRRRLHVLHRGVYAVGHPLLSLKGRWMAAVLASGTGAVLSHRSAAALWELRATSRTRIEVTVPRKQRSRPGIELHRMRLTPDEITTHEGIPTTTPTRTLHDLAAVLPPREIERALEYADIARIPIEPGSPRLTDFLDARRSKPTRSQLEEAFLALVDAHDLPRPRRNERIATAEGYVTVDAVWPEARLVVELDGYETHGTRAAFVRDRRRDRLLTLEGWRVIRVTYDDLQPGLAAQIRQLLAVHWTPQMISTNQFKNGNHIEVEGTVFKILEFQHVKPGKGGAFVRTKLRRAADGAVIDRTFRAGEKFRPIRTEARKMQFLYADGTDAHFMDESSYEQLALPEEGVKETLKWVRPNESVDLLFIDNEPSDIQLAASVELEVTHTEPGVKGDTASGGGNKPATLETGAIVNVPLFVNIGDRVKVDTRSGSYMSRA